METSRRTDVGGMLVENSNDRSNSENRKVGSGRMELYVQWLGHKEAILGGPQMKAIIATYVSKYLTCAKILSTAYHPENDGQSERTIQNLEDMLRACVNRLWNGWVKTFALVEFSYYISYSLAIGCAPFEALLGENVVHLFVGMWLAKSSTHWSRISAKKNGGREENHSSQAKDASRSRSTKELRQLKA
ncbi:putative reverse transcriptase domain-containing protein [Tanacetum coccineum]